MQRSFREGDRVKVTNVHQWMPERFGIIKLVENRIGNRYLVRFDIDELGLWHDEDGDPVLRLGDRDLVLLQEQVSLAA